MVTRIQVLCSMFCFINIVRGSFYQHSYMRKIEPSLWKVSLIHILVLLKWYYVHLVNGIINLITSTLEHVSHKSANNLCRLANLHKIKSPKGTISKRWRFHCLREIGMWGIGLISGNGLLFTGCFTTKSIK